MPDAPHHTTQVLVLVHSTAPGNGTALIGLTQTAGAPARGMLLAALPARPTDQLVLLPNIRGPNDELVYRRLLAPIYLRAEHWSQDTIWTPLPMYYASLDLVGVDQLIFFESWRAHQLADSVTRQAIGRLLTGTGQLF